MLGVSAVLLMLVDSESSVKLMSSSVENVFVLLQLKQDRINEGKLDRTDIDTERPECDGISDLFNWRDVMREFVTCWPAHDDQASPRQRDSITSLVSLLPISCFFFAKVHLAVRGE